MTALPNFDEAFRVLGENGPAWLAFTIIGLAFVINLPSIIKAATASRIEKEKSREQLKQRRERFDLSMEQKRAAGQIPARRRPKPRAPKKLGRRDR